MKKREFLTLGSASVLGAMVSPVLAKSDDDEAKRQLKAQYVKAWKEVLKKYREDASVNFVLAVRYLEDSEAEVTLYEKFPKEGNAWSVRFTCEAYVGREGIGKTREGDMKSPEGDFAVTAGFGIRANPGAKIPYIQVTPTVYACDEEGPYYNQIIDTKKVQHTCKGEEMYRYTPEYNYGLVIDYNKENRYPAGSAIFVHVMGVNSFTAGCVALPEARVRELLTLAHRGMRVVIAHA